MNPTSSKHFGGPITKDCKRSRKLLIRMMYFGVMYALGVRAGQKLEILYVEFDDERKEREGQRLSGGFSGTRPGRGAAGSEKARRVRQTMEYTSEKMLQHYGCH
jgi:hypothetical protein